MSFSDSANHPSTVDYTHEIEAALSALAAVQPREGLEQRILARLASAPELPWYQRWIAVPVGHHRWALAAASVVIVAGGVSLTTFRPHPTALPAPVAVHLPRPAQQPAAAAAAIAVSEHPLEPNKTRTRHRGVHRSFRAMHDRVPLPRGTVAPGRPQAVPLNP
jgi:hypothetical protein